MTKATSTEDTKVPNVIPTVQPSSKAEVLRLQKELKSQGYDPGPLDGVYGPKTAAAVAARNAALLANVNAEAARQAASAGMHASSATDDQTYYGPSIDPRSGEYRPPSEKEIAEARARVEQARAAAEVANKQAVVIPNMATAQTAAQANQVLAAAEKKLADLEPGILDRPWWQLSLAGLGVVSIGVGVWTLVKGKRR